jgi:hypothetical protein
MAQHGGDRNTARLLWTTTYQTANDFMIRENALKHLRALRVDDDIDQLQLLMEKFRQRAGEQPRSFLQLISAGWLRGIPVDPLGRPYKLTPEHTVEVQQPDDLPFITRGLPPGHKASIFAKPKSKEEKGQNTAVPSNR